MWEIARKFSFTQRLWPKIKLNYNFILDFKIKKDVESFHERHGLKGFMIAPTAIINGIGQSI